MSLVLADRVLTGDTLLRGATGRTDLPTGDPEALYDSLFAKLLQLDDDARRLPGAQLQGRAGDDDRPGEGRAIRACRSAIAPPSSSRCAPSASACRII